MKSIKTIFVGALLLLASVEFSETISVEDVLVLFGDSDCIAGSLVSLNDASIGKQTDTQLQSDIEPIINYTEGDKSAMSFINELAQYNEVSYSYELIKEEGPAHSKTFTVALYLGDEKYTGDMQSIKKAQQMAAKEAIKNTKYEHPPVKIKDSDKTLTPTVLLNNLAAKLGLSVSYKRVFDDIVGGINNNVDDVSYKKSYLQKLNDTVHMNDTIHVRKDGSDTKGPFIISVEVNGKYFLGKAHTIQNAKHEAASKALKSLRQNEENFYCYNDDDSCRKNLQNTKSPISAVYEAAQQRNLGVAFEVVDEFGPSHKKVFTTKCVVGNLEITGGGKSKKESKRVAAENMLPHLMKIPEVSGKHSTETMGSKKSKKNKKNKVIKSTFDKIDRMFDNVVDFGRGLVDTISGNNKQASQDDSKSRKNDARKPLRSPTDELFKVAKMLDINIQYSDFVENAKSYSLLDLGSKPSFICLGQGINQKNSRDLASKYGIKMLYKLGVLDNILGKSMQISDVLDKEEAFDKFWLEVVSSNENDKS